MTDDSLPPATEARTATAGPSMAQRLNAWITTNIFGKFDRQLLIVLIMVTISVLGAVTAYRAGLAEQRSILLERRLAHGQMLDIGFREQWLAEILVRIGYSNSMDGLTIDAVDQSQTYKALTVVPAGLQDLLQWRVTEAYLMRRAFRPFMDFLRDTSSQYKTIEEELAALSAEDLRRQGFLATADKGDAPRPAALFPSLQHDIANAHNDSAALTFSVLLFVFGLVCLTLAEMDLGPPLVWAALTSLGVLVAAATAIAVLRVDPGAAWLILPALIVVALATWIATRRGFFRKPKGHDYTPNTPEAPEPGRVSLSHLSGHKGHDALSRSIILFITAAVFASALFGWLYSISLTHAGHDALEAQAKKTEFVNLSSRLSASAMGGAFDSAISVMVARTKCSSAAQLAAIAKDDDIGVKAAQAAIERDAACNERDKVEENNGYIVDQIDSQALVDSAENPVRHMKDIVMNRPNGPDVTLALSDGLAELSAEWNNRAALLLAVLTILAIALYLFGQAYSMGETPAGLWLIRSGATLLVLSGGLGLVVWIRPLVDVSLASLPAECRGSSTAAPAANKSGPVDAEAQDEGHRLVELAALKYAEGVAQKNLSDVSPAGSSQQAKADAAAAENLTCAIRARPGFAQAYHVYQTVVRDSNSPQRNEQGYLSLYSRASLGELVALRRKELGAFVRSGMLRPHWLLGNFAYSDTMLALSKGDPSALAEARTTLDMLTGTAPWWRTLQVQWFKPALWSEEPPSSNGVDWFNLALSQLVTGDAGQMEQAERTYDRALGAPHDWTPGLLASALTGVDIVRSLCRNLHHDRKTCARIGSVLDRVAPRIANGADAASIPGDSPASVRDFNAEATASTFSWHLRLSNFDEKRDRLSVAWYRDETSPDTSSGPDHWPVRRALAAAFDMYYPGGTNKLPKADGDGLIRRDVSYLDTARDCVAPGKYEAEVYLNGRHVSSQEVTVAPHGLRYLRSRELNLDWCMSSSWQPLEDAKGKRPAWLSSLPAHAFTDTRSPSGRSLAGAIMTFIAPASMNETKRQSYFLRQAVQVLLRKGDTTLPASWSQEIEDNAVSRAVPLSDLTAPDCQGAGPLGRPAYELFTDPSNENLIHVGIVDGRTAAKDACTILKSLTTYY